MGSAKATPESLGASDADPGAVEVQRYRFTFQDLHANFLQHAPDFSLAVGVVVVVAKHGNHRDREAAKVFGEHANLFRSATARQVAGQQEKVGPIGEM